MGAENKLINGTGLSIAYNDLKAKIDDIPVEKGSGQNSIQAPGSNASGKYAQALGWQSLATGIGAHAEGSYAMLITTADGQMVYQNIPTTASGTASHAEGKASKATSEASHAEGTQTEASAVNSHAEGNKTTASGQNSHAEGNVTTASGDNSHAEGNGTTASGNNSHAEGQNTIASGLRSHAHGYATIANHADQTVFGQQNVADPSNAASTEHGNYIEIVGNGSGGTRSNARTLDWSGNEVLAGSLTIGGNEQLTKAQLQEMKSATAEVGNLKRAFENRYYLNNYIEQVSNTSLSKNVVTPEDIVNVSIGSTGTYTIDTTSIGIKFPVTNGKTYGFFRLNSQQTVIPFSPRIVICNTDGTVVQSQIATASTITVSNENASYGYLYLSGYSRSALESVMVIEDYSGTAPTAYISKYNYTIKGIPSKTSELTNDSGYVQATNHSSKNIADFNAAYGFSISSTGTVTVDPTSKKGYKVAAVNGKTYGFYRLNSSGTVITWSPRISVVDANDTLITFQNSTTYSITISNASAAYMYVWSNYTDDVVQTCMIIEDYDGTAPTKYIKYYSYNTINAVGQSMWHGKNALIYGDSITAQGNSNNATGFFYGAELTHGFGHVYYRGVGGQSFKINSATFYANADGSYNSRDSGGNPPSGTTEHLGYFASWDRITAMIPDTIRKTIDLVVVCGGTNDFKAVENISVEGDNSAVVPEWVANSVQDAEWAASSYYMNGDYNLSTLAGAIASTLMKLQIWCSNAVIVLATPFSRYDLETNAQTVVNNVNFRTFCETEINIAGYMATPVIDANGRSNITLYNYDDATLSDDTHPNEYGRELYGRPFIGALFGIYPRMF